MVKATSLHERVFRKTNTRTNTGHKERKAETDHTGAELTALQIGFGVQSLDTKKVPTVTSGDCRTTSATNITPT